MSQQTRLQKILPFLACPHCQGDLKYEPSGLCCLACSNTYKIRNGKIYFCDRVGPHDDLNSFKGRLKKTLGKYYYSIGVDIIAPDYPFNFKKTLLRYVNPHEQIVVDIGCGNRRIHDDIICLDFTDYDEVDIVSDLQKLPFKKESVDAFVSRSVLEHVKRPWEIADKIAECTKKDGWGLHVIPFLYPFHASPDDFHRFTHHGVRELFGGWKTEEQRSVAGPISAFLAFFIEFLSIVFSFGSTRLRGYLYLVFCLMLFPLKFLDCLFLRFSSFISISLMTLTVLQKKESIRENLD